MDLFTKLFGDLLVFVYHCFDRIVIRGSLTALSRRELVVHVFPRRRRCRRGQQGGAEPADGRLPELGASLRAQSRDPDRMGRGPRAAVAAPHGEAQCLRRLLHLQEHGATDLPHQTAEVAGQGPALPHRRALAQPHHSFYVCDDALGPMVVQVASFLPFQTTYYLNGHSFLEQELKRGGSASASTTTPSLPSPTWARCRRRPTG